jgi:hypothetical protein
MVRKLKIETCRNEGKATVLNGGPMAEILDAVEWDAKREKEIIPYGPEITVTIPSYMVLRRTSYKNPIKAVVDLRPLADDGAFAAELATEQIRIIASNTMGYHVNNGEDTFVIVAERDILRPGRGEGGSIYSFARFKKLAIERKRGVELSADDKEYLATHAEKFKKDQAEAAAL